MFQCRRYQGHFISKSFFEYVEFCCWKVERQTSNIHTKCLNCYGVGIEPVYYNIAVVCV
jgi:hypothetical protein